MSAINIFLRGQNAYALGDYGLMHADGRLAALSSKKMEIPHLPAVIVIRGSAPAWGALGAAIGERRFASMRHIQRWLSDDLHKLNLPDIDVGVIGWDDEAASMAAYFVTTSAIHAVNGVEPFDVQELSEGSGLILPSTNESIQGLPSPFDIDPKRDGLEIMQRQREMIVPGQPHSYFSVGYAELITVTRNTIITECLGSWPDEVGKIPDRKARYRVRERMKPARP
jgi:hypothetical protein